LVLRPFFEVLVFVLAKAVLVLTMDGLKDLKNCGLQTKKVLRPFWSEGLKKLFWSNEVLRPFLDLKDLKILILDEAKFQFLRS